MREKGQRESWFRFVVFGRGKKDWFPMGWKVLSSSIKDYKDHRLHKAFNHAAAQWTEPTFPHKLFNCQGVSLRYIFSRLNQLPQNLSQIQLKNWPFQFNPLNSINQFSFRNPHMLFQFNSRKQPCTQMLVCLFDQKVMSNVFALRWLFFDLFQFFSSRRCWE